MPNILQQLIEANGSQAIEQFCLDNLPAIVDAVLTGNKSPLQDSLTAAGASPTSSAIRANVPMIPRPEIIKIKHSMTGHYINQPVPATAPANALYVTFSPTIPALPDNSILEILVRRAKGKWCHMTPTGGSMVARDKYNGGPGSPVWDFTANDMVGVIVTEWPADTKMLTFYPAHYYGGETHRGRLEFPILQTDWVSTEAAKTAKSKRVNGVISNSTKQQFFKFRYSIPDPNGRPTDRICGPDSAVFSVFPELGTFEGGIKYFWRFLAIASKE